MNLDQYRKCFNATEDQFIALHEVDGSSVAKNLRYEKLVDVTRITLEDNQFFFFKDGRLKMIYISDETVTKRIWDEFKRISDADQPEETVRSRAGKTSNQKVFASLGFAASLTHDDVDFIEIFPPCSLKEYLDNIYCEPPKFIR